MSRVQVRSLHLTAAQQTAISGSANLFAAVQAAFSAAGGNTVFDFSFGGDTYIADNKWGTARSMQVMA